MIGSTRDKALGAALGQCVGRRIAARAKAIIPIHDVDPMSPGRELWHPSIEGG